MSTKVFDNGYIFYYNLVTDDQYEIFIFTNNNELYFSATSDSEYLMLNEVQEMIKYVSLLDSIVPKISKTYTLDDLKFIGNPDQYIQSFIVFPNGLKCSVIQSPVIARGNNLFDMTIFDVDGNPYKDSSLSNIRGVTIHKVVYYLNRITDLKSKFLC